MIIKIIQKLKTVYHYHDNVSFTIDGDKRTISLGPNTYKISPTMTAYVLNANGATVGIMKVVR